MRFQEKLVFLMNLTSTTNKSLAASMQVHPSMISRLRQGHSDAPCTVEYTRAMSKYFAQHITTDYQRAALAETLEQRQLRLLLREDVLAESICTWLSGRETGSGEGLRMMISNLDAQPSANVDGFYRAISTLSSPRASAAPITATRASAWRCSHFCAGCCFWSARASL